MNINGSSGRRKDDKLDADKDVYDVLSNANDMEVDSDVNEDRNRERLLDESLNTFIIEKRNST